MFTFPLVDPTDDRAIERRLDLDDVAFLDPSTIDKQTMSCDRRHGHLSHGSLLTARERLSEIIGRPDEDWLDRRVNNEKVFAATATRRRNGC